MSNREASGVIQVQFLGTLLNVLSANQGDYVQAPWGEALAAINLTTGVEDDQINRAISKRAITLTGGQVMVLDVFDFAGFDCGAGDGKDMVGQDLAISEIVGILIVLKAGSAGTLKIGGEGSAAAFNSIFDGNDSARIPLRATTSNPGILLLMVPSTVGFDVADVSNHLLKFEAVSGQCDFALYLIARDNP